jgi:hypothetical protein
MMRSVRAVPTLYHVKTQDDVAAYDRVGKGAQKRAFATLPQSAHRFSGVNGTCSLRCSIN